jgi:hypothetical protein
MPDIVRDKVGDAVIFTIKSTDRETINQWLTQARMVIGGCDEHGKRVRIVHDLRESSLLAATPRMELEARFQRDTFKDAAGRIAIVMDRTLTTHIIQHMINTAEREQPRIIYKLFYDLTAALDWVLEN